MARSSSSRAVRVHPTRAWRKHPPIRTAAVVVALLLAATAARAEIVTPLHRFALVAGNDEGGEGTRPLLYARDDAQKIHDILLRLGGVKREDAVLVLNGTAEDFLRGLSDVERKAQAAQKRGERTAIFVYYSGHAKDGALRLGDSAIPFAALKNRLAQAPADVRVGIFDACQSGALTRRKGARRAPEFEVQADATESAKGLVILTSSASDEDSQESDLIGGSYFSHHLASGLLGDADRSADGRVSLSEAYAYAYERTVADTSSSAAGAQHPTYSYDFQGNGDLVLTDLVDRREGLVFPANAPGGVYYVVDGRGFVAAEVWKAEGTERRIAVPPGTYTLKRRLPDRLRVGQVTVGGGAMTAVEEARLRDVPFSDDPVKGPGRAHRLTWVSFGLTGEVQSFFDGPVRENLFPSLGLLAAEVNLHGYLRRDWVWGFDIALGGGQSTLHLQGVSDPLPYSFAQLNLGSTICAEFPMGRWVPQLGARLALLGMSRTFQDPALPRQTFLTLTPGIVAGVRYRITPSWGIGVRTRVHYLLYNVDENRSLGYWELAGTVGYEL